MTQRLHCFESDSYDDISMESKGSINKAKLTDKLFGGKKRLDTKLIDLKSEKLDCDIYVYEVKNKFERDVVFSRVQLQSE